MTRFTLSKKLILSAISNSKAATGLLLENLSLNLSLFTLLLLKISLHK